MISGPAAGTGTGMDALREFVAEMKQQGAAQGNFLGLLNVLIGRQIRKTDGTLVAAGCPFRTLAAYLKLVRWDKQAVRELGIDPKSLHPRDRVRFWFQAIVQARVDSKEAILAGDRFAAAMTKAGYMTGHGPPSETPHSQSGLQA